jgi:acylpyruvate hydrolase
VDLKRAYHAMLYHTGDIGTQFPSDMAGLLSAGDTAMQAARKVADFAEEQLVAGGRITAPENIVYPADQVTLLPPVPRPDKLICLGLNYPDPANPDSIPKYPILFLKTVNTLSGHNQPIMIPRASDQIDYEGELAIVIGRRGKHIPQNEALDYIAGYTIANDVGARDLEARSSQWITGKILDTFCPLGPVLVPRDEVPDHGALAIRTTLNGEVVQYGNTRDMIFDVPSIVHYLSTLATLEPGDVILTGSPKGIGAIPAPRRFMQPGDVVSIEIEGLGTLTNPVIAES